MYDDRFSRRTITKSMVGVAQLVRAPVCGIGGRGFEPLLPPQLFQGVPQGLPFFVSGSDPASVLIPAIFATILFNL